MNDILTRAEARGFCPMAYPGRPSGLLGLCQTEPPLRSGQLFIPELESSGFSISFYKRTMIYLMCLILMV